MLTRHGDFLCGQHVGMEDFGDWLSGLQPAWGPNVTLGWEAYLSVGARSQRSTYGLRVMGVAQWLAHAHGWTVVNEASPDARMVASMEALRRLGWYRKGQPHAMDAARHLLAYLVRSGIAPEITRQAFTNPDCGGT
jgi:hypothetical protein